MGGVGGGGKRCVFAAAVCGAANVGAAVVGAVVFFGGGAMKSIEYCGVAGALGIVGGVGSRFDNVARSGL